MLNGKIVYCSLKVAYICRSRNNYEIELTNLRNGNPKWLENNNKITSN